MEREFHLPEKVLAREASLDPAFLSDERPLDVEIGCGVGLHPIRRALNFPERKLIAIEHTREKFEKFAGRLVHHPHLPNLLPVHANAISWISKNLPPQSIDQIFLLYPNPNPQRKNQRWFMMPFMHRLLLSLKNGGRLHLATNIEAYFSEALEQSSKLNLRILEKRQLGSSNLAEARTHFEKKYLARGETCFNVIFEKPDEKDVARTSNKNAKAGVGLRPERFQCADLQ